MKKGFSFVELVSTVTIISVLAAIIFITVSRYIAKSRVARLESELLSLKEAIKRYEDDVGRFPPTSLLRPGQGVAALFERACSPDIARGDGIQDRTKWLGPYLTRIPTRNPYGNSNYAAGCAGLGNMGYGFYRTVVPGGGVYYHIRTVVTSSVAQRVDNDLDNGDGLTAGSVRYFGTTMYFIVVY